MSNNHVYDMIVVGGGPGGYTAALYAARAGLDTIVLEKLSAGGQMALTEQIDNYPGFEDGIDGFSLAEKMQKQAERFGARSEYAEVLRMDLTAVPKLVETSEGIFLGKTVVLATGANPRTLGVARESELVGRGVAYCAACDGMFYKGKTVVVVGGGNPNTSFDCSGFVSWALTQSGVCNTGRLGAQGLYNISTPVSSANARPGDLIFFVGTYDTPGVSHVGIYVGGGKMLHCGDPIQYADINTSYWQSHFYAFGRPPYN